VSQDSPTGSPESNRLTAFNDCVTEVVSLLTHQALRKQSRFHLETAGLASKLFTGGAMIISLPHREGEPPEISYIGGRFRLSAER
jgi:hypothetical protein